MCECDACACEWLSLAWPCHTWKMSFILLRCRGRSVKRDGTRRTRMQKRTADHRLRCGPSILFISTCQSLRCVCDCVCAFGVRSECVLFHHVSFDILCLGLSPLHRIQSFYVFKFDFFFLSLSCAASENRWVQWRWQIFAVNLSQSFRNFCTSTENWINSTRPNYTTLYVQYEWRWKTMRNSPSHRHRQMERGKIEIAFDRRLTSPITCIRPKNWWKSIEIRMNVR